MDEAIRISNLENEVAQLRLLVETMTAALQATAPASVAAAPRIAEMLSEPESPSHPDSSQTATDADALAEATSSRRGILKLLGAAAAGAVGATALAAGDAAAAATNIQTEVANTASVVGTRVNYNGANTDGIVFLAQSGTAFDGSFATYPAALGGWTSRTNQPTGVYGYTSQSSGDGVVGVNAAASGLGVGVHGLSSSWTGVHGEGPDYGVRGESLSGTGVYGEGVDAGVSGQATGAGNPGLFALGDTGVEAWADPAGDGYALAATFSGKASLFLRTTNDFIGSSPKLRPSARTDAHVVGEIDTDSLGDVWYCTVSGTPGTWRKLAGPSTAGSFHALSPGRVYDSRAPLPVTGTLASGASRTISVANKRDLTTGAVVTADFVPVGATAITANVTVVSIAGGGFLTCNPGGVTAVDAATINWSAAGQILNNGVTLTLNATRQLNVIAGGGGTTDFIIDVTGYYL